MNRLHGLGGGRMLIAALGLALVAMAAVGAGYFTRSHSNAGIEVAAPSERATAVRGVIQSVTADSVTLLTESGAVTLKITASTPREAIQAATLADIKPGDWVNAGAVGHAQTLYALTALVLIPAANLEAGR